MNILVFNHEFPPVGGGGAIACQNITKRLAAAGHQISLVTCSYDCLQEEEILDGVRIYRVKCRRSQLDRSSLGEMLSFLFAAFRKMKTLVRVKDFDYTFVFFGIPSGPLGYYLYKKHRIPYIIRLGGGDIPGAQKRYALLYKLLSFPLKLIWKNAAYVVPNSNTALNRSKAFANNARFTVIANGIELSGQTKSYSEQPQPTLKLTTVARIIEGKGIQYGIEALSIITKRIGPVFEYTIIGDGPFRTELEKLVHELGVVGQVHFIGRAEHTQITSLLIKNDIFLFPSLSEGFPNAVLEAMSVGLPVIMTNCGGYDQLIDGNGYVVTIGDSISQSIADNLAAIYNNQSLLSTLSQNSRRIAGKFSWQKTAEAYDELFRR